MENTKDYKVMGVPLKDLTPEQLKERINGLRAARSTVPEKRARATPGTAVRRGPDLTDAEEI